MTESFDYKPAQSDVDPYLTVVTRVRDAEPQSFAETAHSIQRQSFQRWEWLVLDNGSTRADTREALARWSDADSRIRIIRHEHRLGPHAALAHPHSSFILEIDSGDLLEPTAVEKWLWFLSSHPECSFVDSPRRTAQLEQSVDKPAKAGENPLAARRSTPSGVGVELEPTSFDNPLAKTRRRLLMIVPRVTTGGADKFNLDLTAQLQARGWEISAIATLPGDNSWAPRLARLTPDVFILQDLLKPGDYPRFLRYMIESRQPDVILISNSQFAYRALPYLRRLAHGIPIVDYCHSVHPDWLNGGYPQLSVEHKDHLDLQVASSEHLRDWMVQQGADPGRVKVCYTNADLPAEANDGVERAFRLGLALPEQLPVIIYPCRVDVEKQPKVFAKTVLELHRRDHRFAALVVGDGPYLDWLQRFVTKHRLHECVKFLGRRPNEEVRRLMAFSDCVFLPSQFEGISLAFFEAMAEGVAVVGARVGGQRELVTPDCGILIERGDEQLEVARYVQALEGLLDDPDKRRLMGEAGQQRIRDLFLLDAMGSTMDDLLEHARQMAASNPRPCPTTELAHTAALNAVREVAAMLPGPTSLTGAPPMPVRLWLFRLTARIGMPIHRLGLRLGLHWIEGLRQRVADLLQPSA